MSEHTNIQWCDSTVNPTMGCDGCELWTENRKSCYAGVLHQRHGGKNPGYSPSFEQLTQYPGRMAAAARWSNLTGLCRWDKPWLDGLPRLIFVSDMSDALSRDVPFDFLQREIIETVTTVAGRRHQWLWLTKRPERMVEFCRWLNEQGISWPANVWAGTSVTTQQNVSRIERLLRVGDERTIRFVSLEPQWEPVDLGTWLPNVDWLIQGGESGFKAKPFKLEWARQLHDDCQQANVPFFIKQLGVQVYDGNERIRLEHSHAADWTEWPSDIRIRQLPQCPKKPKTTKRRTRMPVQKTA